MTITPLLFTGSLCLTLALIEAWLLVIVFSKPESGLARLIPGTMDLLKSHIDYLMMSMFSYIFFLLFSHFQFLPPIFVVLSFCLGSLGNPALFFIRALYPALKTEQTPLFRSMMVLSCLLTTLGFLAAAWLIASAAV
jgi:hypothetical protein